MLSNKGVLFVVRNLLYGSFYCNYQNAKLINIKMYNVSFVLLDSRYYYCTQLLKLYFCPFLEIENNVTKRFNQKSY